MDLPVFQHVDQLVRVRLVQRYTVAEPKMMENARRRIVQGQDLYLASLIQSLQSEFRGPHTQFHLDRWLLGLDQTLTTRSRRVRNTSASKARSGRPQEGRQRF